MSLCISDFYIISQRFAFVNTFLKFFSIFFVLQKRCDILYKNP
ncbi:hypothetical protein EUBSIR_00482 [[Eubacterium] siraeum DSM 15702]|uniref:Uncharacterized protein n=1 Tax=[Eubacterium] siraeum DSM 15702 TaxID=428128 RepID=B0MKZ1_9FIRM|nr:hypothetical protein EUBSIR_00482 [[Eubacterium] siraeum DSM 15702]